MLRRALSKDIAIFLGFLNELNNDVHYVRRAGVHDKKDVLAVADRQPSFGGAGAI